MRSDTTKSSPAGVRRGLTLTDVCVVLALLVLLGAGFLPQLGRGVRENANRMKCGSNLRQISQAGFIYSNTQKIFPRLYWDRTGTVAPNLYTGPNSRQMFVMGPLLPEMPKANDVTGAMFLLLRSEQLEPGLFNCPSDNATPAYKGKDVQQFSNFVGRANLSYSYSTPYPVMAAVNEGWNFKQESGTEVPFASDMSFGDNPEGGPTKVAFSDPVEKIRTANSANHSFEGQNVAFADGHVEWSATPFCGVKKPGSFWPDNIFTAQVGVNQSDGKGGVVMGLPQNKYDAVLLPTYFDGPQPPGAVPSPSAAASPFAGGSLTWVFVAGGVWLAAVVGVVLFLIFRKKPTNVATAAVLPGRRPAPGAYPAQPDQYQPPHQ